MTTLQNWADTHNTSIEIARSIFDMAGDDHAERVWEAPTDDELVEVTRAAFQMTDEDTLFWGAETVRRDGSHPVTLP